MELTRKPVESHPKPLEERLPGMKRALRPVGTHRLLNCRSDLIDGLGDLLGSASIRLLAPPAIAAAP